MAHEHHIVLPASSGIQRFRYETGAKKWSFSLFFSVPLFSLSLSFFCLCMSPSYLIILPQQLDLNKKTPINVSEEELPVSLHPNSKILHIFTWRLANTTITILSSKLITDSNNRTVFCIDWKHHYRDYLHISSATRVFQYLI